MYQAITRDIRITVNPQFLEEQSDTKRSHFLWSYTIQIDNLGREAVMLETRRWRITDGHGKREDVRGVGVVGEQPRIEAGESFQYTSGCPLSTPDGIMEGEYLMITDSGERFHAVIPAFALDSPYVQRINH